MEEIITDIKNWLRKETENANASGLLVGVSGGLDSAVVANLIKLAYPENSLGVVMPLRSNPIDLYDAEEVVKAADINSLTIDLTEGHHEILTEINEVLMKKELYKESADKISDANLRARLRMSTLYTIASQLNYLVVGTDNAAEWYTGYFTKYGDGGVDLQPIIQLTKQEVRSMAESLKVPLSVIEKNPSADLWEGQTDEDEMGTSYDHIDAFLEGRTVPDKDKAIIERMHQRTAHKRTIAKQFIFR